MAQAERPGRFTRALQTISALTLIALLAMYWFAGSRTDSHPVPFSEIVAKADANEIRDADIGTDSITVVTRADEKKTLVAERIPDSEVMGKLVETMQKNGVRITGHPEKQSLLGPILWTILPIPIFLLILWAFGGAMGRVRGNRPMSFGKSQAKLYDRSAENKTTFADVAGVDEAKAELIEVVRFLKDPAKFREAGARVPKGVLLVGSPGTGKTLLAKAVAGESGVPFFSMSGSEFVEMFVGVGASRVRDLFEQAKERAPCIIFIDELDAIGKSRAGASGFIANEEREQTLNQLLVEMDGFESEAGIVIMAATNRPEILDRALLRAGRFDRQVVVERPDVRGREAILRVHVKRVQLAPDVDLAVVARRTPGMVGADLANVVNEAALATVRRGQKIVAMRDFEEAIDRIQLGLKKEGRVMTDEEKRRVAYHESGHALLALRVEHSDPVHRVTIIPRSIGALGATLQLPTEERYLMTRVELRDRICILLGGRAAEEIVCKDVSTGAEDDLERATELARLMVCRFGMSEELGMRTLSAGRGRFSNVPIELGPRDRDFSERTAQKIDEEIDSILEQEHERARRILGENRTILETVAKRLLAIETLERPELEELTRARTAA